MPQNGTSLALSRPEKLAVVGTVHCLEPKWLRKGGGGRGEGFLEGGCFSEGARLTSPGEARAF
eukprot:1882884-Pyramimonas_sp.AAC.1